MYLLYAAAPFFFMSFGCISFAGNPQDSSYERCISERSLCASGIVADQGNVHIIIDLGGVCFETDLYKSMNMLGWKNIIGGFINGVSVKDLVAEIYQLLESVECDDPEGILALCNAKDHYGVVLPLAMRAWLAGTITEQALLPEVIRLIDHSYIAHSQAHKQLLKNIAYLMFIPENMAGTRRFIKDAYQAVRNWKRNGYTVSVLSNWSKDSFVVLRDQHRDFFDLFDDIRVSGYLGLIKPHVDMYTYFTQTYPSDFFIFIDDQLENIQAATAVGMYGVLVPKKMRLCRAADPDFRVVQDAVNSIINTHYKKCTYA